MRCNAAGFCGPGAATDFHLSRAAGEVDLSAAQPAGTVAARWLFDAALYRERYPDLTAAVLKAAGMHGPYEHYVWIGDAEGRSGSLFFDPACYQAALSADAAVQAAAEGTCAHFLRHATSRKGEIRTSVYFDPAAYLARYPAVAAEIAAGRWVCALHHYLANDAPTNFDPSPQFSERFYLARYPDVGAAVAAGVHRNGYQHFLRHGVFELRVPCEQVDLGWYVETHGSVAEDIAQCRARDAFAHYLAIGQPAGLAARVPPEPQTVEAEAPAFRLRAQAMLSVFGRRRLDFACAEPPTVSVAMVTRDSFAAAMLTLGALRATYRGPVELLLVDAGSRDETRFIERFVTGARILRLPNDPGRHQALDAVLTWASAPAILLLDDHVELAPGALDAALERLGSEPRIGAVVGRVVDVDAAPHQVASPRPPGAGFVHDAEVGSELFLLLRATLHGTLGGGDEHDGTGSGAADLCGRIANAGFRVVYDPAVVVLDHAPGRRADPRAPAGQRLAAGTTPRRRVLFIDDTVPLRMIGSGFVRSNDLIGVMTSVGFAVTVFPLDQPPFGPATIAADLPDEVEVIDDGTDTGLEGFLRRHADSFHAIWIARTHNLDRIHTALQAALAECEPPPLLVLDTEAIVALRSAGEAALHGRDCDLPAALAAEFRHAGLCRRLVAVSEQEATTLRGLGFDGVSVIGHLCEARPTPRRFAERAGLLFVGAVHKADSPNHDGLCWLIDAVLPLVEQELGWETRLTVAGYLAPGVSLDRYRDHPRVSLRGAVTDTNRLYDSHRAFVAPTRYAAGLPYKVHEAASFGLPVVTTELLRTELCWTDEAELLAADPADPTNFARCIVRLYRDEALWQQLREGALLRIRAEHGREAYARAVLDVLGT